jgi:hypothetical protein
MKAHYKGNIEILKLSKPYPVAKIVRDGRDFVISIMSFYLRIHNLFN